MFAHLTLGLVFISLATTCVSIGAWLLLKTLRVQGARKSRFTSALWKRTASVEPHIRPAVNGMVLRQVAVHVARRHHAPLPKEPGKLWR